MNFNYPKWDLNASLWGNCYHDYLEGITINGTTVRHRENFGTASFSLSKGWRDGQVRTFMALENFITTKEDRYTYDDVSDFNWRASIEIKF